MKIRVPPYAKRAARQALLDRFKYSKPPGLEHNEAHAMGIASGVDRARQLLANNAISEEDARHVAAFYSRFRNMYTPRAEVAIGLWGGRRWGRELMYRFR